MQNVLEFLINHYILFIVISGILIFSLIGFLVDTSKNASDKKEDMIKEEKEDKPKEKKNKKLKKDEIEDNTMTVGEAMAQQQQAKNIDESNQSLQSNDSTK